MYAAPAGSQASQGAARSERGCSCNTATERGAVTACLLPTGFSSAGLAHFCSSRTAMGLPRPPTAACQGSGAAGQAGPGAACSHCVGAIKPQGQVWHAGRREKAALCKRQPLHVKARSCSAPAQAAASLDGDRVPPSRGRRPAPLQLGTDPAPYRKGSSGPSSTTAPFHQAAPLATVKPLWEREKIPFGKPRVGGKASPRHISLRAPAASPG